MATAAAKKSSAKAAPKKAVGNPAGRISEMFGGKKIKKLTNPSPFRKGSLIEHAYTKVMKDGMVYEEYLAKGGRRIDLADAVKQGHVKMTK